VHCDSLVCGQQTKRIQFHCPQSRVADSWVTPRPPEGVDRPAGRSCPGPAVATRPRGRPGAPSVPPNTGSEPRPPRPAALRAVWWRSNSRRSLPSAAHAPAVATGPKILDQLRAAAGSSGRGPPPLPPPPPPNRPDCTVAAPPLPHAPVPPTHAAGFGGAPAGAASSGSSPSSETRPPPRPPLSPLRVCDCRDCRDLDSEFRRQELCEGLHPRAFFAGEDVDGGSFRSLKLKRPRRHHVPLCLRCHIDARSPHLFTANFSHFESCQVTCVDVLHNAHPGAD